MPLKRRNGGSTTAVPDNEYVQKELFHKALACKTRLKIMALLERQSMFGHELVKRLGIGQSTVSYHISILRKAGLVAAQPQLEGVLYSLVKEETAA